MLMCEAEAAIGARSDVLPEIKAARGYPRDAGEYYTPGQTNVTRQSECTLRPELVAQRQVGSCPPA